MSPIKNGFPQCSSFSELWRPLRAAEMTGMLETEVIIWGQAALAKPAGTAMPCRRAISIPHSLQPHTLTAHRRDRYTLHTAPVCHGQIPACSVDVFQDCIHYMSVLCASRLMCMWACACILKCVSVVMCVTVTASHAASERQKDALADAVRL